MVYVVDDDAEARHSLCSVLRSVDLRALAFPSAEAFLGHPDSSQPSCLVLDVRLGNGRGGLDLQAQLGHRQATVPIVFTAGPGDIRASVLAMKAGAFDVLEKPLDHELLLTSVRSALASSCQSRRAHAQSMVIHGRFEQLTPRERQLLWLVVDGGMSNRQMAAEMGAAVKTIKIHRGQITKKMRASSVAELVRMVGLLPPEARADAGPKWRPRPVWAGGCAAHGGAAPASNDENNTGA
jgi:FixJ family two-component response regulator